LYNFVEGGNGALTKNKREMMFVQMLEGLHKDEADVIIAAKDKVLHKLYTKVTENLVEKTFPALLK